MPSRREILQAISIAALAPQWCMAADDGKRRARHIPADVDPSADRSLPAGKRAPVGWTVLTLSAKPISLTWPDLASDNVATHFRISCAMDVRDEKLIDVSLAKSGRTLGTLDIRFANLFQIYQIALSEADSENIRKEGIVLKLTKGADLRIFCGGADIPNALMPHLLLPGETDSYSEFFLRLNSLACIQPFGWMEGCVLDGLLDLSADPKRASFRDTARLHLSKFCQGGKLVYENPAGAPNDDKLYGIEATLPIAALAQLEPTNPLLDSTLNFWKSRQDADGGIIDGKHTSSEGAYTVGYPLAVIGKQRRDTALEELALAQLRVRQARLFDSKTFWRTSDAGSAKGNRNWARGIAWQLLGMVRTLRELEHRADLADVIASAKELAEWSLQFQRKDGLWSVFVDESNELPDTAGSAGIAAALAIGSNKKWFNDQAKLAASRCLEGLKTQLTTDGLLGGVSQANKGGEALQRGNYRVIYQMGMGLMGQLIAALS